MQGIPLVSQHSARTIDVVMHDEPKGNDPDLLYRICGLYRLLDLINEQGSGGAGMIKAHMPHYRDSNCRYS